MPYSVNTTALLEDYTSENEDEGDTLNNVGNRDSRPLFKVPEVPDKYYTAYLIFYLLGMVTLLPWCFFVTADDYWLYKFRDVTNGTQDFLQRQTPLQVEFTSYLNVASGVPTLLFLILNIAIRKRISLNVRILGPLMIMVLLFVLTLIFVNINTDEWQNQFFILTLITVILLNACSAVLCGSLYGIVGKFSPVYMTAVVGGQALGGIFAASAQIVSLAIGASSIHSAFVYFTIGSITIFSSSIFYVILIKSRFFKFHSSETLIHDLQDEVIERNVDLTLILRKIWTHGLAVSFILLITTAVYPGVTVLIESAGKGHGNKWNDMFFVPTVNYLLFNVGDYLGRLLAGRLQQPRAGSMHMILSTSRFIFIPLLILCNAQPRHHWAVVFNKDYEFIIILFLFALSNGYLVNLTSIAAPRVVDYHEKETASTIMSVFVGFGLAVGSVIGYFMLKSL